MEDLNVTSPFDSRLLIILINDLPHLVILKESLLGYQSYISEMKDTKNKYVIEFYLKGNPYIIAEYDEREKWEKILKLLKTA